MGSYEINQEAENRKIGFTLLGVIVIMILMAFLCGG